ncbi:MAG TPA: alpha/beta hydrolase [Chitinophagaceae bacterium]|nr:alpha/beta hydrolase [Chitinophagaceae bacterium]
MKCVTVLIFLLFLYNPFVSAQKVLREQRNWALYHTMGGSQAINSIRLSTGVELEYVEQGDEAGIPVIFLHGYTDSWHSFETILPYLPGTLHVFAITQRGHGNSSKPKDHYHPKDFAADIAAFIKETELGKAVIVGHSLGGVIAQQFALDYPEYTKALVIVGSDPAFNDNPGLAEFRKAVMQLSDPVDYKFAETFQKSTINGTIDSNYLKLLINETLKLPAGVWKEVIDGFMGVDYTKELYKIEQPVLIFWGDKDEICPRVAQDIMAREIKNARLAVYKETGHALHWEQPDRFANDLLIFIQTLTK